MASAKQIPGTPQRWGVLQKQGSLGVKHLEIEEHCSTPDHQREPTSVSITETLPNAVIWEATCVSSSSAHPQHVGAVSPSIWCRSVNRQKLIPLFIPSLFFDSGEKLLNPSSKLSNRQRTYAAKGIGVRWTRRGLWTGLLAITTWREKSRGNEVGTPQEWRRPAQTQPEQNRRGWGSSHHSWFLTASSSSAVWSKKRPNFKCLKQTHKDLNRLYFTYQEETEPRWRGRRGSRMDSSGLLVRLN